MADLTLAELEDILGNPIVLLTWTHPRTKATRTISVEDLTPALQTQFLRWINDRIATKVATQSAITPQSPTHIGS